MNDREHDARVAALWILHGGACVKLLRAHGRYDHAENFEDALNEVASIVADEVGEDTLSAAMDWASDQLWGSAEHAVTGTPERKHLH
ncbi:MAG TPA: hypothetical protein VEJ16_13550 [Alphaproteobacteria bacterium]|nr:hypothetical protein [Alphaproteobacteria bacterium]